MKNRILPTLIFLFLVISVFGQKQELSRKDTMNVQWVHGTKYYQYRVEKGETIYSISKKFGVSQEDLKASNPELEGGLKTKMLLLIPSGVRAKNSATLKNAEENKQAHKELRIALMLPLKAGQCLLSDSISEDTIQQKLNDETLVELEFYEGAMHAVEQLASSDMRIYLGVYDTEDDSSKVSGFLKDSRMKDLNYIVASGNYAVMRRISQFTAQQKIGLLTFTLNASEMMKASPMTYSLTPSSITQCYEAGKLCSIKFAGANALVLKTGSRKENERSIAFSEGWNDVSEQKCKPFDYSKADFTQLLAALMKGRNNLLFVPTSNEDFVNSLLTQLHDTTDVYEITVIGIPTWQYFGSIDPAVMENLHTNLFTASHVDAETEASQEFRKYFRYEYYCEPAESAYQGYDVIMLIKNWLMKTSSGKENELEEQQGLYSTYRFKMSNGLNENQYIRLIRYEDYRLVEVK